MLRSIDTSILSSRILLPQSFQILTPTSNSSISRSQAILLTWDNVSPYTMELYIEGECGTSDSISTTVNIGADTGQYLLNASAFSNQIDYPGISTCSLRLNLRRLRSGVVNSAYGMGGSVTGVQQQTINIVSTP